MRTKKIGHHTRLEENLLVRTVQALVRALMTQEIMPNSDA